MSTFDINNYMWVNIIKSEHSQPELAYNTVFQNSNVSTLAYTWQMSTKASQYAMLAYL